MVKTLTPESSCSESNDRYAHHHRVTKSADRISESASSSSSCKYRGVRKRKWGKFVSEIRLPNSRERIWLGSYDSAVKAARAFDAALFCLRGPTAKFNFPDNPPEIPGGRTLTPAQIQAEAARFANSGLPIGSDQECSSNSESDELQQVDSPSLSDGATNMNTDSGSGLDNSFIDQFRTMSSDFGYFPGFDDYQNDFITPNPSYEVEEPSSDEFFTTHGSFLWNFN